MANFGKSNGTRGESSTSDLYEEMKVFLSLAGQVNSEAMKGKSKL